MSATGCDLRQPAVVERELAGANARLAGSAETPAAVIGLVEDLADAIGAGDRSSVATVNPWLWIQVQGAALRAQAALREEDPVRRRALRLALEQLRFLFARIAERAPVGEAEPAGAIARWLEATLAAVPQAQKAALVGVSPRTYQRWIAAGEAVHLGAEEERRLRVLARLVNQLRHSLTAPGVIDWFDTPRQDLDGAAPGELLGDPARLEALLGAAAASRGHVAA
ncbi:hypothetical protein [Conexibacter sp. DBS9H8]|uniref:hypothetical protein n=1 Tax=Conexibacter sp. DBS9H8 TaxID=2937801 RepID=UPI00200BA7D6|nr:hypothetical protein [Conexibacter sp. DBS9H8]